MKKESFAMKINLLPLWTFVVFTNLCLLENIHGDEVIKEALLRDEIDWFLLKSNITAGLRERSFDALDLALQLWESVLNSNPSLMNKINCFKLQKIIIMELVTAAEEGDTSDPYNFAKNVSEAIKIEVEKNINNNRNKQLETIIKARVVREARELPLNIITTETPKAEKEGEETTTQLPLNIPTTETHKAEKEGGETTTQLPLYIITIETPKAEKEGEETTTQLPLNIPTTETIRYLRDEVDWLLLESSIITNLRGGPADILEQAMGLWESIQNSNRSLWKKINCSELQKIIIKQYLKANEEGYLFNPYILGAEITKAIKIKFDINSQNNQ